MAKTQWHTANNVAKISAGMFFLSAANKMNVSYPSYPNCPGRRSFSFFGKVASYASNASGCSSATK